MLHSYPISLSFEGEDDVIICRTQMEVTNQIILHTCVLCMSEDLRVVWERLNNELPYMSRKAFFCDKHYAEIRSKVMVHKPPQGGVV